MQKILKLLLVIICILFNITIARADVRDYIPHKITVQFEEDFSSEYPPKSFNVTVYEDYYIKNMGMIAKGTVLYLEILKVSDAKRAKRDASVEARIVKVYSPINDETVNVNNPRAIVKLSKYKELDKGNVATNVGITVANHFVKHITYPAHFVKGVVKDKEGNRLKSGVKEVYDSSILSYVEKGEELNLQAGDLATLTYYTKKYQNN